MKCSLGISNFLEEGSSFSYSQNYNEVSITSFQSEWPSSISLQTLKAGEGMEKRDPYYTVGGNANWHIHYGEQYIGSSKV